MVDLLETSVSSLLNGTLTKNKTQIQSDYTLAEEDNAIANFLPILRETVTYIVAVILINADNQVLLIQEAKASCREKWYLPAGRVEKNETLYDAAIRETLEETGLEVKCTTLLKIEASEGVWLRFSFMGVVTGGKLKTLKQADEESLQAKWFDTKLKGVSLRSKDFVHLVERATDLKKARDCNDSKWHQDLLVNIDNGYKKNLLRLLFVAQASKKVYILVGLKSDPHLPICDWHPSKNITASIAAFAYKIFGTNLPQYFIHGCLSVEHNPKAGDGCCLTLIVSIVQELEKFTLESDNYVWHETSQSLGKTLLKRIESKDSTIPLVVRKS